METEDEGRTGDSETTGSEIVTTVRSWITNARYKLTHRNSTSLPDQQPVWILGRPIYPSDSGDLKSAIMAEAQKVPWCSYRNHIEALVRHEGNGETKWITSDVGWGCTLRVGQMLLLTALSRTIPTDPLSIDLLSIVALPDSPYSLRNMLSTASRYLCKQAGDMFAPSTVAYTLYHLISTTPVIPDFSVSVSTDGGIFTDQLLSDMTGLDLNQLKCTCEVQDSACVLCSDFTWRGAVLLLVPTMLGRDKLSSAYLPALQFLLHLPQSLGIIGGKRHSAVYFIGFQGDFLLYLDPHYVQKSTKNRSHLEKHRDTYQVKSYSFLPIRDIDSSLTFAFYIDSARSFREFQTGIEENKEILKGAIFTRKSSPGYLLKTAKVDLESEFIEIS